MIIACEECGKQYQVDLNLIQGAAGFFSCVRCNHGIEVVKPGRTHPADNEPTEPAMVMPDESVPDASGNPFGVRPVQARKEDGTSRSRRFGLRPRMLGLFFVVPSVVLAVAAFFLLQQIDRLSGQITDRFLRSGTAMAEEAIAEKARSVAKQVEIWFRHNPGWKLEELNTNPEFRKIAIQKVGKTGYTVLFRITTEGQPLAMWVHPNPKMIGVPLDAISKKIMGADYGRFHKILLPGLQGKRTEVGGYYTWVEKDGSKRDKYLLSTPIGSSAMGISATTYIEEFTQPMLDLQGEARGISTDARWVNAVIIAGSMLVIGLIVFAYSYRLSGRIAALTSVADKISLGELDVEIDTRSRDEIGDMAEAIIRMKDSIQISMDRLRRRRLRN